MPVTRSSSALYKYAVSRSVLYKYAISSSVLCKYAFRNFALNCAKPILNSAQTIYILQVYGGPGGAEARSVLLINSDSSRLFIDERGPAVLRFRINAVSKTHQGQNFCVCLSPNTAKVVLS